MFKNKSFTIAFSISALWHIFWMSALNIAMPGNLQLVKTSGVSFLGPILDKTAFDVILKDRPKFIDTIYKIPQIPLDGLISLELPAIQQKFESGIISIPTRDRFEISLRGLVANVKKIPSYHDDTFQRTSQPIYADRVQGPASVRVLLYKPEPPRLPNILDVTDKKFTMKLKFYISADGKVERVQPVSSSGYPDVDLLGVRYIKEWKFEPKRTSAEPEWGIIDLDLEME